MHVLMQVDGDMIRTIFGPVAVLYVVIKEIIVGGKVVGAIMTGATVIGAIVIGTVTGAMIGAINPRKLLIAHRYVIPVRTLQKQPGTKVQWKSSGRNQKKKPTM